MADTFKFPNGGYDVTVLRKQDVLDCIDENIIDKDIAFAIVERCEIDAATFIREGIWTGIPFMGNIRFNKSKLMENDPVQQALIEEAKETLDRHQYIVFRKQLNNNNIKHVKQERLYNYLTSIAVNRNRKLYKRLCNDKGESYAKIFLYASKCITAVNNEYVNIEDNE